MFVHLLHNATRLTCRAVYSVGLRLLALWNYGFESHRRHGCLSIMIVVSYQVVVFATG